MKVSTQVRALLILCFLLLLTSCSYNPFRFNNRTTGSPTAALVGATVGAGSVALVTSSKPLILLGGLTGGAFGYYVTTLRYDAGGVIHGCGEVYKVGDYVGIVIPSDKLFEPNTADFLPSAPYILNSAAAVLQHNPGNNIMISGNTSGFARTRWERRLSEKRAQKISAFLWNAGVGSFYDDSNNPRKLNYVGYGNYFPIANNYHNDGIRANSRIQITSYPTASELLIDKQHEALNNVGGACDRDLNEAPACDSGGASGCACGGGNGGGGFLG